MVHIDSNQLPLSEEEKKILRDEPDWQTKDFECVLADIKITQDGKLERRKFGVEEEIWERLDFDGRFKFYTWAGESWYEFLATLESGVLVGITGGSKPRRLKPID